MSNNEVKSQVSGLKGWLILVGFGVILQPFILLKTFIIDLFPLFHDGSMDFMLKNISELAYLIYLETFVILAIIIVSFFNIYLFFTKKKLFPKLFIIIILFNLFWLITDGFLAKLIVPHQDIFDEETIISFIRISILCSIWVPYMIISKRVKNTFIN